MVPRMLIRNDKLSSFFLAFKNFKIKNAQLYIADRSLLQISLHGDRSYFHRFLQEFVKCTHPFIYYFVYPIAVGYFTIYLPCQAVAEYVPMIHVA